MIIRLFHADPPCRADCEPVAHDAAADAGRSERSEAGETLIEILATLILLSLAIIAIIGLLWTMMRVTKLHREATTSGTEVVNVGEHIVDGLGTDYEACAQPANYSLTDVPSGYQAEIVQIRYLENPQSAVESWKDTCSEDHGVQQVTIEAWSLREPQNREQIRVVKRNTECRFTSENGPLGC